MDWIQCADGSHLKASRIVSLRITTQGISDTVFAVSAEVDTSSPRRRPDRDLFTGTREACEAYLEDFMNAEKDDAVKEDASKASSSASGNRKTKKEPTKKVSDEA